MIRFAPPPTDELDDDETIAAFFAHTRALSADTPGHRWWKADHRRGRASICKALRLDPNDRFTCFATAPFRIVDEDGAPWIAGAIGLRCFDPQWGHTEIRDVVLWNPRSGDLRIAGEATSRSAVISPAHSDGEVDVFASGFAFFRAWTERRAEYAARHLIALSDRSRIRPTEPADSNIPGILVIGDLDSIHWRELDAPVLKAGTGVEATKLKRAIFRSARLPRVVATGGEA
jgi:hypothetical protein